MTPVRLLWWVSLVAVVATYGCSLVVKETRIYEPPPPCVVYGAVHADAGADR